VSVLHQKYPDVPRRYSATRHQVSRNYWLAAPWGVTCHELLNAGIPVKMLEMKQEALDAKLATIAKNCGPKKKASSKQDQVRAALGLLGTARYDDPIGTAYSGEADV
jgi:3-hydroxyacyl-CoA dehydrogenase